MKNKFLYITIWLFSLPIILIAQDEIPTINPMAHYINDDGDEEDGTSYSGSAPLDVRFTANTENAEGWDAYYEWRFTNEKSEQPYLIRYEEDTEYKFTTAGSTRIMLYAIFTKGNDKVEYTEEYWEDQTPIIISISESRLDMPNAFSPNGDGINDIYKAKQGYQSLVEFNAKIFNRWGQLLYEWTDPADGWDGTFHGQDVAQGVYFVQVIAKGADGIKYHFRKDVNLLRGYNEDKGINE